MAGQTEVKLSDEERERRLNDFWGWVIEESIRRLNQRAAKQAA